MVTFAELKERVEHLSSDEIDELREILKRKKEEEVFKAVEEARKNSKEGRNVSFSSTEDIEAFFTKIIKNGD